MNIIGLDCDLTHLFIAL